jgi:dihydropteroate synthase
VNVTPDSFSDGGRFLGAEAARARIDEIVEAGADVIEIGAESTRPAGAVYGDGYTPVDAATQLARATPALEHAVASGLPVAIDTTDPAVAAHAISIGATIVNDVSTLRDPALARLCADRGAWLVLMHARAGSASAWTDVVAEVGREWSLARDRAVAEGLSRDRILFDPGIGFGKGARHGLELLARLPEFHALGHPIYVGASRKAFIAASEEAAGLPRSVASRRVGGTISACLAAVRAGAAVIRVHDVAEVLQAFAVEEAIARAVDEALPRAEEA